MEQLEREGGRREQRMAGLLGNMDRQVGLPSVSWFDFISDLFFPLHFSQYFLELVLFCLPLFWPMFSKSGLIFWS